MSVDLEYRQIGVLDLREKRGLLILGQSVVILQYVLLTVFCKLFLCHFESHFMRPFLRLCTGYKNMYFI